MRISTNTLYQTGINNISSLQSEQYKLQEQISASKRILTPADDPVGAARALVISQAQSVNSQYADNRTSAESHLNSIESTLTSVTNLLVSSKTSIVSAGNAALSTEEKSYIAEQLQNDLDELVSLANSKDGNGDYMFGGFNTTTAPYTATSTGATYNGDSGQLKIQVSESRQMPVTVTGTDVFQADGNDIFASYTNIINLLSDPNTSADDLNTALSTVGSSMEDALDTVLTVRSSTGSKLNELESLNTAGDSRDLQYTSELSDIQDLDYAAALSDLSKKQTILEAAQQSYVTLTGLSLFDYIS